MSEPSLEIFVMDHLAFIGTKGIGFLPGLCPLWHQGIQELINHLDGNWREWDLVPRKVGDHEGITPGTW